jgi:ubiquinone/menaquinone biosynthesis C-methylase UbiE
MVSIKNWDNKTWLSSPKYINSFNKFLIKQSKINKNSKILDIGCGRGKILGNLKSKLKLKIRPVGIDIEKHKDRDKKINFKQLGVLKFFKKNKDKFDLILIKQTIHLFKFNEIKKILFLCKKNLNYGGKIIIFSLDTHKNEIPTFSLMSKNLRRSLITDKKIFLKIKKNYPKMIIKKFVYKVKIKKSKYIEMIRKRFISILLNISHKNILEGVNEFNSKNKNILKFNDKLVCLILNTC